MRTSMWNGARARFMGGVVALMLVGLTACGGGGGGGSEAPAFGVNVSVDGVADAASPLTVGEASTISVPSGATLGFASEGETRWAPTATASSYAVNSFSFTSKSMTVTSMAGGSLVVVFTNKANASEKATLTVNVAPQEFGHVARTEGEVETWAEKSVDVDGTPYEGGYLFRTTLLEGGGYGVDVGNVDTGEYYTRSLYDAQDRYLGYVVPTTGNGCTYDDPIVQVSYPLHVGKTWSGSGHRDCPAKPSANFDQSYARSVEAFESITVPEGSHDALRIRSEVTYSNFGYDPEVTYTVTSTCWWAVDLGRNVKCDYVYHYTDGQSSTDTVTLTKLVR